MSDNPDIRARVNRTRCPGSLRRAAEKRWYGLYGICQSCRQELRLTERKLVIPLHEVPRDD